MVQVKDNREFESFGADLTSNDANEGYVACSKSKIYSMLQDTEKIMCYHCRNHFLMIMKMQ